MCFLQRRRCKLISGVRRDDPIVAYKVLIKNRYPGRKQPSVWWHDLGREKYYSPHYRVGWRGDRKSVKPTFGKAEGESRRGIHCYASKRTAVDEWDLNTPTLYEHYGTHKYVMCKVHIWGDVYRGWYYYYHNLDPRRPSRRIGYLAQHCEIIEELKT